VYPDPNSDPLAPTSSRFPLGPPAEYWSSCHDRPSETGDRPYSLRGVVPVLGQPGSTPVYSYDPRRQVGLVRGPDGQYVELAKHTNPGATPASTTGYPGDGDPNNPPPEEMGAPDYQTDWRVTVLILARDIEPQVDRVVEELTRQDVPVFRTDLAAFPQALTLEARLGADGWDGELATEHRSVRLSEIRSVWYRHPSHFTFPEGLTGPELRHAAAEARSAWYGVLTGLAALWVNFPSREADAVKPRQLDVARRYGLRVPDTSSRTRPPLSGRSPRTLRGLWRPRTCRVRRSPSPAAW
jgi:hypothetical protein